MNFLLSGRPLKCGKKLDPEVRTKLVFEITGDDLDKRINHFCGNGAVILASAPALKGTRHITAQIRLQKLLKRVPGIKWCLGVCWLFKERKKNISLFCFFVC